MLPIVAVLVTSLVMLTLASPWLGLGLLVWVTATPASYGCHSRRRNWRAVAVPVADHGKVMVVGNLNSIRLFAARITNSTI